MKVFEGQGVKISYDGKFDKQFEYPDFMLEPGKCLCIRGKTGCGKSTLLNGIFGYKFEGMIKYKKADLLGKDVKENKKFIYQAVSYIPQFSQNALNPSIKIGQHIKDVEKSCMEAEDYKAIMGNLKLKTDILNMYPHELSGGMKQRAVLLLCLIKKPRLLVLDEPSTAIDAATLKVILDFLVSRKTEGLSMMMATHDFGFSKHIADDYIVLDAGGSNGTFS